jgi:hypothetical protein
LRSYPGVYEATIRGALPALLAALAPALADAKKQYELAYHDYLSNMYLPLGIVRDVKWETSSSMVDPFLPIIVRGSMDIINMVVSEDGRDDDMCGVLVSRGEGGGAP